MGVVRRHACVAALLLACTTAGAAEAPKWYIPPEEGPVIGNQNGWFVTPRDILPGQFTFSGKAENVTAESFEMTPSCVWGRYTYRVRALEPAPGKTPDFRPRKVIGTRDLQFGDLAGLPDDTTLLAQGEVTEVFREKNGFLAALTFAGGPLKCRFDVVKAEETKRRPDIQSRHYGPHWQHTFDVYYPKERGEKPLPVLFYIHGGGWGALDKDGANRGADDWNKDGIAVISINYRFVSNAQEFHPASPPVEAPLRDAARALQYVRYHAKALGIDPDRIALTGGSAGGATSCWLAMHDDMADPQSPDPVARMSTRVTCAAPQQAQTSLDPKQMREWIPEIAYGAHAFFTGEQMKLAKEKQFEYFLAKREEIRPWIREYSPYEWASKDDPPMFHDYGGRTNTLPAQDGGHATHHPKFGEMLHKRLKELGVESHFRADDAKPEDPRYAAWNGAGLFVRDKLLGPEWEKGK